MTLLLLEVVVVEVGRRGELVGGMARRLCWWRTGLVGGLVLMLGELFLLVLSLLALFH